MPAKIKLRQTPLRNTIAIRQIVAALGNIGDPPDGKGACEPRALGHLLFSVEPGRARRGPPATFR